jgi:very-short-patch-repair endonuclease
MPREDMLPGILAEWHFEKNHGVSPESVNVNQKVWWQCRGDRLNCTESCNHPHEWRTCINSRFANDGTRKVGCPYCSNNGKSLCPCRSLLSKRPDLAQQFHPTKNGLLTPQDVSTQSSTMVVWICTSKSNCTDLCENTHEWPARVSSRVNGDGCPYCSTGGTDTVCPCQSLLARRPDLAGQFHPTKNGFLTPQDISIRSKKKVWWIGDCSHEYNAAIYTRTRGSGCPKCCVNKAEKRLEEILSSHALISRYGKSSIRCYDHIQKKRRTLQPDCIGVTTTGNKFMIELDGPQHFEKVFWYDSDGSDLRDQICRDLCKNRYAADHGMSLLRVSYKEYADLETWVNTFLEKCNNKENGQVMIPSNPALYNSQRDINLG